MKQLCNKNSEYTVLSLFIKSVWHIFFCPRGAFMELHDAGYGMVKH